jgi:hypothetical protein
MRFLILCLLLSSTAFAQDKRIFVSPITTHFTAQSCISTVPAASRTAVLEVGNLGPAGQALSRAVVSVQFTYNASSTVTMQCTSSNDGGTTDYILQDCVTSSGTSTCSDLTWSKGSLAADKKWPWRIDTAGFVRLECTFLCSGAGTDALTVKSYQTTK